MEGPSKGDAREEELRDIVHGLFEEGQRMMRLKPMPAMQDSVRGLGAVTRELCLSARPLSPASSRAWRMCPTRASRTSSRCSKSAA